MSQRRQEEIFKEDFLHNFLMAVEDCTYEKDSKSNDTTRYVRSNKRLTNTILNKFNYDISCLSDIVENKEIPDEAVDFFLHYLSFDPNTTEITPSALNNNYPTQVNQNHLSRLQLIQQFQEENSH